MVEITKSGNYIGLNGAASATFKKRFGEEPIKVGDVFVVRDLKDMQEEFGYDISKIDCGWAGMGMAQYCGVAKFTVDDDALTKINAGHTSIFRELGYSWSLDMLKRDGVVEKDEVLKEVKIEKDSVKLSIINEEQDEKIIEKMISLVDKKRFAQILAVAASSYDRKIFPKQETVDWYLNKWATAKYDFFIAFGEKLTLEEEIESEIDEAEMRGLVFELAAKFKKYSIAIDSFHPSEFIKNEMHDYSERFRKFEPRFQHGMKVSKFISMFFEDKELDIEVSKVLQNRHVKGKIVVSIDPYDYLTASLNKHSWRSCHSIENGEYGSGCVSYMIDPSTIIAYKHNGKEYSYNVNNFKWEGNSKSWRQLIYFDKGTSSFIGSKHYPGTNDQAAKVVRELIEKQISKYLGVENKWYVGGYDSHHISIKNIGDFHYSDVSSGYSTVKVVRHTDLNTDSEEFKRIKIEVGVVELKCVSSGKMYSYGSGDLVNKND